MNEATKTCEACRQPIAMETRASFLARLRDRVEPSGMTVLSAEPGRNARGFVWVLAVTKDNSVATLYADVPRGEPRSTVVCEAIAAWLLAGHDPHKPAVQP